jgi:hypothetical protein
MSLDRCYSALKVIGITSIQHLPYLKWLRHESAHRKDAHLIMNYLSSIRIVSDTNQETRDCFNFLQVPPIRLYDYSFAGPPLKPKSNTPIFNYLYTIAESSGTLEQMCRRKILFTITSNTFVYERIGIVCTNDIYKKCMSVLETTPHLMDPIRVYPPS